MSDDNKLYQKVEKIAEDITVLKVIAAKQEQNLLRNTEDLKLHMKRSDKLEEQVDLYKSAISAELAPLQDHVKYVGYSFKVIGIAATAIGVLVSLFEFLSWMKKLG